MSSSLDNPCPVNFHCPTGSENPEKCSDGQEQPLTTQSECQDCTAGFYCQNGERSICTENNFCPANVIVPEPCAPGTYSQIKQASTDEYCINCPPGFYCDGTGIPPIQCSDTSIKCVGGCEDELCSNKIDSECDAGNYCENGYQYPCAPGTFKNVTGAGVCEKCQIGTAAMNAESTDCDSCADGFYCDEGSYNLRQHSCEIGSFCTDGVMTACPTGETSLSKMASVCEQCPPYYQCVNDGSGNNLKTQCHAGFYCQGGIGENPTPCPVGTYGWDFQPGKSEASYCLPCKPGYLCDQQNMTETFMKSQLCPPGSYCPQGQKGQENKEDCPAGFYCLEQTPSPHYHPCPIGTFSNNTNLSDDTFCEPCTPGFFCATPGLSEPTGLCQAKFYCPGNTNQTEMYNNVCQPGHQCPEGSQQMKECPVNFYSSQIAIETCLNCPTGYDCPALGTKNPVLCPIGHFCDGSGNFPEKCPVGSYNPYNGAESVEDCHCCPGGYVCDNSGISNVSEMSACDPGFYCPSGSTNSTGVQLLGCGGGLSTEIENKNCEIGYYCPGGEGSLSAYQTPCEPGFECTTSNLSNPVDLCSEGFYCSGADSDTNLPTNPQECPRNSFCETGSIYFTVCPAGSSGTISTKNENATSCLPCDAGKACILTVDVNTDSVSSTTQDCSEGFYCLQDSFTYSPNQNICPQGYSCPAGDSSSPIACVNSTFQKDFGQSSCENCPPGFECEATVQDDNEFNKGLFKNGCITPADCEKGYFCAEGEAKQPCPVGTIGVISNLQKIDECTRCPNGFFCDLTGQSKLDPAKICPQGQFCSGASTSLITDNPCPAGAYCPEGVETPKRCPPRTYANLDAIIGDRWNISMCASCQPGFACPDFGMDEQSMRNFRCKAGYYCPEGSESQTEEICPEYFRCPEQSSAPQNCAQGTYAEFGTGQSECVPCPDGKFCQGSPYGPTNCELGKYCPAGNSVDCPPGTYSNFAFIEISKEDHCTVCPPGFYCDGSDPITPTPCPAGYFCPGGNDSGTDNECQPGYYCSEGSSEQIPCNPGEFNSEPRSENITSCQACVPGSYCDVTDRSRVTDFCEAGWYCESNSYLSKSQLCDAGTACGTGSNNNSNVCSLGEYQPEFGQDSCVTCEPGTYCDSVKLTNYTNCVSGQFCPNGQNFSSCTSGFYGAGDFQTDQTNGCQECPAGFHCDTDGLPDPIQGCQPGFYCPTGSKSDSENECQPGFYCPENSTSMQLCPPGKYCGTSQLSIFTDNCDAGYYCEAGSVNKCGGKDVNSVALCDTSSDCSICPDKNECPVGFYCEEGTGDSQTPCPTGTFNGLTSRTRVSDCSDCTAGSYCEQPGLSSPSGNCAAGFYCPTNSSSKYQNACPIGNKCPESSFEPTLCENSTYTNVERQSVCVECPAGYYCFNGGIAQCLPGNYCPESVSEVVPCPPGTFSNEASLQEAASCQICPESKFCIGGETNHSGDCTVGYYCPPGSDNPTAELCPAGKYCEFSPPTPCPKGTWNNETSVKVDQTSCNLCPAGVSCPRTGIFSESQFVTCPIGHYCLAGNTDPITTPCQSGHYCPENSPQQIPCRNGTYLDYPMASAETQCKTCPGGKYCPGLKLCLVLASKCCRTAALGFKVLPKSAHKRRK